MCSQKEIQLLDEKLSQYKNLLPKNAFDSLMTKLKLELQTAFLVFQKTNFYTKMAKEHREVVEPRTLYQLVKEKSRKRRIGAS